MAILVLASPAGLTACGGGGGGGGSAPAPVPGSPPPPPPPPPPPSGSASWTAGVYPAASTFKDRCAVVRTGRDIEGNAFPDLTGTALDERFWLRSWTNETYLWNTEVVDRDPAGFSNRLDYFAILRTFAQTASGKDKDDFHFSEPTTEFLARRNSAPSATYGASLAALSTTPPRDFRVRYTEPGSPAAAVTGGQPAFERGSRILRVNGIDLVNTNSQADIDQLNAALFPSVTGINTTFDVRDADGTNRTVTLTSANLSASAVNRTAIFNTPTGNVGYILFNTFGTDDSERQIVDAIQAMRTAGVQDLVVDLRYNGGGLLAVASQLSYMVAGNSATQGQAFERLQFNAAAGSRNPVLGGTNSPVPFYDTGVGFSVPTTTALPSLNLPRVFILSTSTTCSASEAVINGLRGVGVEVVMMGSTTCGKPFGFYPQDNCGETYYTIQFQGVNARGFGDYADGFIPNNSTTPFGVRVPGCVVADDLNTELGDPAEGLLSAALNYRTTLSCPPLPSSSNIVRSGIEEARGGGGLALDPPAAAIMDTNRDMYLPPRP